MYFQMEWYTYQKYLEVWKLNFGEAVEATMTIRLGEDMIEQPVQLLSEEAFEYHKLGRAQANYDVIEAHQRGDDDALYSAMADCMYHETALVLELVVGDSSE